MSDEDVMLVNFVSDASNETSDIRNNVKVTGGKWRDRRKLKMMIDGKDHTKRVRTDDPKEFERQLKKIKESGLNKDEFIQRSAPDKSKKAGAEKSKSTALPVNSQIVSSLFTSNREVSTSVNTNKHDETSEINPSNAPLLEDSFEALGIREPLFSHLEEKMRIKKPTNIQKLVLSQFSSTENNDLFINAQTGSGKTLAFLLPILSRILKMNVRVDRKSGCFALIIAPTRELASQIYSVASMLTNSCHYLVPCLLIGGERKKSEKARLRKGSNFIIGTPGRILDHLQNTKVITEQMGHSLRYVILDEGDKLMELGFEETITNILDVLHNIPVETSRFPNLPSRIVHVLCSATLQGGVTKLGKVALKDYKLIRSGGKNNSETTISEVPDQLIQKIAIVPPKLRLVTLAGVLDGITKKNTDEGTSRTIVFLSCADSVDFHYDAFSSSDSHHRNLVGDSVRQLTRGNTILPSLNEDNDPNVIFYKLHGSLSQQMRVSTLDHFSKNNETTKGKHLIMFCTDVASRGLDLPYVGTVIEMDPPFSTEDHLHRTGRTARAGHKGEAILFLFPGEEEGYLEKIKPSHPKGWKLIKFDSDVLKPAFGSKNVKRNDKDSENSLDKALEWDTNVTTWHLNIERRVLEDPTFKSLAMKAFTSHVRAYATHLSQEKQIFNVKFLHLGHLAKGFALRERPKGIAAQSAKNKDGTQSIVKKPTKENNKNKMFRMARMAVKEAVNEFNY